MTAQLEHQAQSLVAQIGRGKAWEIWLRVTSDRQRVDTVGYD